MSLPPALRAGLEAVEPPGGVALVACSGGVDSVSLAAAAVALGRWRVRLAYVDHGLQRRAGAQARCVRALGAALGCGVDLLMADPRRVRGGGGLEDGARQARYACLAATAARRGAAVILTAHTADDQAETVLMRLASGAGSRGLAGIPARRGPYARPWLGVSKAEIIAFAVARGLAWVEDPSNADERHARNRLRARRGALDEALGPAWARGAARAAAHLAADRAALDLLLDERLAGAAWPSAGGALVDMRALLSAPPPLHAPLLLRALRRAGRQPRQLQGHLDALLSLASGRRWDLPEGLLAERQGERLWIGPRGALTPPPPPRWITPPCAAHFGDVILEIERLAGLPPPGARGAGCVDLRAAPPPWRLRAAQAGDRLQPLGAAGHKGLSRRWRDAQIPLDARAGLPVLEAEGRPFWALGLRVDERARAAADAPCVRITARLASPLRAWLSRFDPTLNHLRRLERP